MRVENLAKTVKLQNAARREARLEQRLREAEDRLKLMAALEAELQKLSYKGESESLLGDMLSRRYVEAGTSAPR